MSITLNTTLSLVQIESVHQYNIIDNIVPQTRKVPAFLVDVGLVPSPPHDRLTPLSSAECNTNPVQAVTHTFNNPKTIGRPNRYLAMRKASESTELRSIAEEPDQFIDGKSVVKGSPPPSPHQTPKSAGNDAWKPLTQPIQTGKTKALSPFAVLRGSAHEFAINGYRRGDPTVKWDDETPASAIVAPHLRHPQTELAPSHLPLPTVGGTIVGVINASSPPTLPLELHAHLAKREGLREYNANMDLWRQKHAPAIIKHHHDHIFTPAAEDRNYTLKNYHMSEAYHGQKPKNKTRGRGHGRN